LEVPWFIQNQLLSTRESGEADPVWGFGGYCEEEKGNTGRNPQTEEELISSPMGAVVFKCQSVLRNRING